MDLDHLLIGLLVVDGGAERLLMAAGLRLGPARQAIAAQERADVRALGLDDALSGEHWAPPAPMKYTADLMPFTVAAKAVVKDCRRWRETDLRLLEQLVADPEAPGGESAEASQGRWRRHAGNGNGNVNGLGNVPSGAFPSGGRSTRVEVTVPVSADALWATIADPARRPEWDDDTGAVKVLDDLTFTATPRFMVAWAQQGRACRLPEIVVTYRVIDQTPGHFVEWELRYLRRERRDPHSERGSIEITPIDGGTRITLTASRSRSRNGLVRRWWDWTGRHELRVRVLALAQVS